MSLVLRYALRYAQFTTRRDTRQARLLPQASAHPLRAAAAFSQVKSRGKLMSSPVDTVGETARLAVVDGAEVALRRFPQAVHVQAEGVGSLLGVVRRLRWHLSKLAVFEAWV